MFEFSVKQLHKFLSLWEVLRFVRISSLQDRDARARQSEWLAPAQPRAMTRYRFRLDPLSFVRPSELAAGSPWQSCNVAPPSY